jgi:uncharacterized membrane protein
MIAAIFILAVFLRLFHLQDKGIVKDEKASVLCATGFKSIEYSVNKKQIEIPESFTPDFFWRQFNLRGVRQATIQDNGNSVLYNIVLHFWIRLFSPSDFSVRLLSVVIAMLVLVLGLFFAHHFSFNSKHTCLFLFLLAIHPVILSYSQMSRAYILCLLLTMLATFFYFKILKHPYKTSNYLYYTLSVALSMLGHFLTAYIFMIHFVLFPFLSKEKKSWLYMGGAYTLAVLMLSLWYFNGGKEGMEIMSSINQTYADRAANPSVTENFALPSTPYNIFAGWAQMLLATSGNLLQNAGIQIRFLLPFLFLVVLLIYFISRHLSALFEKRMIVLLTLLSIAAPLFATYLAIQSGHIISFQVGYTVFSVPYAMALLSGGYFLFDSTEQNLLKKWLLIIIFSLHLFTIILSVKTLYFDIDSERFQQNHHALLAKQLSVQYAANDTVILPTLFDAQLVSLYLKERNDIKMKIYFEIGKENIYLKKQNGAQILLLEMKGKRF